MATLTATIKWATNTAELIGDLRQGVATLEITQDVATRVKGSMDAMAAGISAAGRTSADSARLIAGMSASGREAAASLTNASSAGGTFSNILAKATPILGAFGISLSLGALVSFGKQLIEDADALQKMSDRTGIGVENLQRLQRVGDDTSVTIEEMTQAINQMQDRLAGGDPSAAAAMERMGINTEKFLKLDPYQQFVQFSDALRQVANSSEQVRDANDVMGKSGVKVLAALKQGFEDVKNEAVPMSSGTVEALDHLGDAITHLWRTSKGFAAEFIGNMFFGEAATNARAYAETMRKGAEATDFGRFAMKTAAPVGKELAGIYETLNTDLKTHNEHVTAQTKAVKELYPEWYTLSNGLHKANLETGLIVGATAEETEALLTVAGATDTWGMGIGQLTERVPDLTTHIEEQTQAFADLEGELPPLITAFDDFDQVARAAQQAEASLQTTHELLARTMGPVVTGIADMNHRLPETTAHVGALGRAFGVVEEVLGGIQTRFAQVAVVGARTALTIMDRLSGVKDITGAVVAGVVGLIEVFGKLFHDAEKAINGTRAAFVDAAGGLDALRDKATEAGVTINALLNAKNAEQYKAAIDALNLAFNEHAADIDRAKALIDEYGLSIEQLGPKWRAQQLDEQVTGLLNDLRIMVDVLGLSMPDAITVMAGKFQAAFDTAMQFGIELPEQMRPILQRMIELGLLTDASGNKYANLEETGVQFSESFAHSVDRLIVKFEEFLARMGDLPSVADRAADGINSGLGRIHPSPVHVEVILDWPNVPPSITVPASVAGAASGALVTATGIQHLSTGGRVLAFTPRGTDTVPAMLTPGEEVIPVGGRAKEMAPVVAAINKLGRDLPQQLAVAVRDEVQKKVGRR